MKTTITYNTLDAQAPWPTLLTQQLEHWHTLAPISAAEVILEHQFHDGAGFRVKVRLEVSRRSLRTDASDPTLEGALLMATQDLERQIQTGNTKPIGRARSPRQPSAPARRGNGGTA
jgi:hypothetical protein